VQREVENLSSAPRLATVLIGDYGQLQVYMCNEQNHAQLASDTSVIGIFVQQAVPSGFECPARVFDGEDGVVVATAR